ncbi:hypothetical protein D9M68_936790 [compost metagenome]
MAMPAANWIRPVLRKAMVSSDTSELDCTSMVALTPNIRLLKGVAVLSASRRSSLPPASWRKPSSRHCMPNRNSARPAHRPSQPALNQKLRASRANRKIQLNDRNRRRRLRSESGIQCAFIRNH